MKKTFTENETNEIVNNYTFRCAENLERAALLQYINTFGDPTAGLWSKIEEFNGELISIFEKSLDSDNNEYSESIVDNINRFIEKDRIFHNEYPELFNSDSTTKKLDEESFADELLGIRNKTNDVKENLEKIKTKLYYAETTEGIQLKQEDYVLKYGNTIGEVFSKLENFYAYLLKMFEDLIILDNNTRYLNFIVGNIENFEKRDQKLNSTK